MYRQPPHLLQLYLTDYCNLACKHCLFSAAPTRFEFLEHRQIKVLLDAYRAQGFEAVAFSGGEAITSPHLVPALDHAHQLGFKDICVNTNGISDAVLALPRTLDLKLAFSVDGYTAATHELLRGSGTQAATVSHLRAAIALGRTVYVIVTVHRHNRAEIVPLVHLLDSLGVTVISFNILTNLGRARAQVGLGLTPAEWRAVYDTVMDVGPLSTSTLRIPPLFLSLSEAAALTADELRCRIAERSRTEVTPLGHIFHCCLLTTQPAYAGGTVTADGITLDNRRELQLLAQSRPLGACPARLPAYPEQQPCESTPHDVLIPVCSYYRTLVRPA